MLKEISILPDQKTIRIVTTSDSTSILIFKDWDKTPIIAIKMSERDIVELLYSLEDTLLTIRKNG